MSAGLQGRDLHIHPPDQQYLDTVATDGYNTATFYSYDIHGNVDTLLQDYGNSTLFANLMNANSNRFKKTSYAYDLISGKVNKVAYQQGWGDQVFHRYGYDAENRLTQVETSFDNRRWEQEAQYKYYRHGPLSRIVLGSQQVQGLDYAYTLQGWLKGVNSTALDSARDLGNDAFIGGAYQYTARDAIGFNINYYDTSDYQPISVSNPFPGSMSGLPGMNYRPLFNGNISSMAVHNRGLDQAGTTGGALLLYNYRYDQLNRLRSMSSYNGFNTTTNSWSGMSLLSVLRESPTYDANGNILSLLRYGHKTATPQMDNLSYTYASGTNTLTRVTDGIGSGVYGNDAGDLPDMDTQGANNYSYDEIGNLTKDNAEGITDIQWSVYGKILAISKTATAGNPVEKISYTYDAQGNRISKRVERNNGTSTYTWYARDAQGNTMATYRSTGPTPALCPGYSRGL